MKRQLFEMVREQKQEILHAIDRALGFDLALPSV
jgi:hypothetical protein